ncbi:MAG: hypothetical protein JSW68_07150 [Burkholderiales bacterium]|nr:MAG: hypothetical protein JSW68_07150 [Burkholderiales bacterium]
MASNALAQIDWSAWTGLEPIPLGLLSDGDPATADLRLEGVLGSGGAYAYGLQLTAGLEYRFGTTAADDGFAELALLVDPDDGGVLWGNAAALGALGFDSEAAGAQAAQPVAVDADDQLVLLVAATLERDGGGPVDPGVPGGPFLLEAHADVPPQPEFTDNAVYRFVKLSNGMYFYTASEAERALIETSYPDLRFEGPVFVGDDMPREGWVPVYRFANLVNGSYFYTADLAERDTIIETRADLRFEGEAFWVPGEPAENTLPVYKLINLDTGGYLFTSNPVEKLYALLQGGWQDEGIAFQSLVPQPAAPAPSESGPLGETGLDEAQPLGPDADASGTETMAQTSTDTALLDGQTEPPEVVLIGQASPEPDLAVDGTGL